MHRQACSSHGAMEFKHVTRSMIASQVHVTSDDEAISAGRKRVMILLQGVVYASPRVDEVNMSRDHSHGNIHVHNRADDSAHANTYPKPHADDEAMV